MDEALKAKILKVLGSQHLMTLATLRPDGYPQATTVNYISDGFTIYFAADAASQKVGNIKLNSKVAAAIASEADNFYRLAGVSLSGNAKRLMEPERADEVLTELFRRLPQSKRFVPDDRRQLAVLAIAPVAISLVDYASGYGTSYVIELESDASTTAPERSSH